MVWAKFTALESVGNDTKGQGLNACLVSTPCRSDRSVVIQPTCNLLNQVCANMKSPLIWDRSNESSGLPGAKPARSSGPQNDTERTGNLAP